MRIKMVIFDLDGPILDSFREGLRRIRILCTIYDIPCGRKEHQRLTQLWGIPGVELIVQGLGLNETFVREIFYPAWERFDFRLPLPLVPRTREVLTWLRRNKIAAAVLTSRHREHVLEMFERLDLSREFTFISAKFDTPYRKPDPKVFSHMMKEFEEKLFIMKPEVIFVGDTPADIDAGTAAGIETVLVQTGPYLLKHADKLPLPLSNVLNSIDDLPSWIEENHEGPLYPYD